MTPAFYLPVTAGALFVVVANYFFASQITRVSLITIFSLIFLLAALLPLVSRIWPTKVQKVNSLVTFLAGQTALIGMSFVFKIDIATTPSSEQWRGYLCCSVLPALPLRIT